MKNSDIASYADANTPYNIGDNIDQVISPLQNGDVSLFKWLSYNQMKVNPDKYHLFINESCKKIAGNIERTLNCEKLLGIKIDIKRSFKTHVEDLC